MWPSEVNMTGVEAQGGGTSFLGLPADLSVEEDGRHSGSEDVPDEDGCDAGIHRCSRCDFESLNRLAFVAHISECTGDNMVDGSVGESCDGSPDRHNRKMFECDVCNMKFSNGANMRRHKMRHTGVKPYECRVCQKRFFRKDHLAEHFTTHTKTLPYHCPICNRGFQRQIAMRAHFQNEHVGQHDMVKSCPLCSFRAGSMKSLRVHFYNRHGIDLDNPVPSLGAEVGPSPIVNGGLGATVGSAIAGALSGGAVVGIGASDHIEGQVQGSGTPPMHFLTPHIEISMTDPPVAYSPGQADDMNGVTEVNGEGPRHRPRSPVLVDSCSAPVPVPVPLPIPVPPILRESPDTNLNGSPGAGVPVKQEPRCPSRSLLCSVEQEHEQEDDRRCVNGPVNLTTGPGRSAQDSLTRSNSMTALIKVSPLKNLLRDEPQRGRVIPPKPRTGLELLPLGPPSDWRAPPKLQCVFCGIAFPDQTLYFLHKGCHSDANPWKCNICGEQCCSVYDFNAHLLSKSHQ